jgi:hypothetical protein
MDSFLKNRDFAIVNHNKPRLEVKIFRAENIPLRAWNKTKRKIPVWGTEIIFKGPKDGSLPARNRPISGNS